MDGVRPNVGVLDPLVVISGTTLLVAFGKLFPVGFSGDVFSLPARHPSNVIFPLEVILPVNIAPKSIGLSPREGPVN